MRVSSGPLLGLLACAFTLVVAEPAAACSLVSYSNNGRYIGGDLASQISTKADTIQIVRVTAKHLVRRTYSRGAWYVDFGDFDVPNDRPEFTDEFVFELSVVETLKDGPRPPEFLYENSPRILGYDRSAFRDLIADASEDVDTQSHPNSLPIWLLDRPGDHGYAFIGAAEGSGLGGGECSSPYMLDVGQTLVALRDSMGRLYPAAGAFPLEIDVEFATGQRRNRRFALNMQSLVPVSGPDDPFVGRLRQALARR